MLGNLLKPEFEELIQAKDYADGLESAHGRRPAVTEDGDRGRIVADKAEEVIARAKDLDAKAKELTERIKALGTAQAPAGQEAAGGGVPQPASAAARSSTACGV